jgi:BlaI family transcriptional regulator, penicillinase repressor
MARPASEQPTPAEIAILNVLWNSQPATARQIHEKLGDQRQVNYSTIVKLLTIMQRKALIKCDDSVRPQLFRACASREKTATRIVRDLAEKIFDGSTMLLAMQALSAKRATDEEIAKMRALLDQLEKSNDSK